MVYTIFLKVLFLALFYLFVSLIVVHSTDFVKLSFVNSSLFISIAPESEKF